MVLNGLVCTGDPLLDLMLDSCSSFASLLSSAETVAEALEEAKVRRPDLLFVSPALGDLCTLRELRGTRICCLVEGIDIPVPTGVDCLIAERMTPQLVDDWVRPPKAPPTAGVAPGVKGGGRVPPPPGRVPPPPPLPPSGSGLRPPAAEALPQATPPSPHAAPVLPTAAQASPPRRLREALSEAPRPALKILRQQVITFWGGKPGAGRSTLAVALSDLLSRAGGIRLCTVDLNSFNSSLAALVGKEQDVPSWFHLGDALARGGPFPVESLRWVRPNWAILGGPGGRADWTGLLTRETIGWIVDSLRAQFDFIILDPEVRPGPVSETAVRLAQTVLLTLSPDYPDVLDSTRAFETALEEGWLDRGRCRLILNRWVESPHLPAADVADCFGLPVGLAIPANPEATANASGQGVPVTGLELPAARSLSQALSPLVGLVAEPVLAAGGDRANPAPRRGWFSR